MYKLLEKDYWARQEIQWQPWVVAVSVKKPQGFCMTITMGIWPLFRTQVFWQRCMQRSLLFLINYTHPMTIMHDVLTNWSSLSTYNIAWIVMMLTVFKCNNKNSINHPGMVVSWRDGNDTREEKETQGCSEGEGKQRFHRLSTWRYIPEGNEVFRVLIHLPYFTFRRHGSRLGDCSVTMTVMFNAEFALLLKCSATGDTSVLRCMVSDRWPLILAWSGWHFHSHIEGHASCM